jgi:hypothetical protein
MTAPELAQHHFGARTLGLFIAPREPEVAVEPTTTVPHFAARAAVLGSPSDAPPIAAALANALRTRDHAPTAALAVWPPATKPPGPQSTPPTAGPPVSAPATSGRRVSPLGMTGPPVSAPAGNGPPVSPPATTGPPDSAPATPAAGRLAARLNARNLPASARGRLAWARLPIAPDDAVLSARRVGAALEVPLVVALAGPRDDAIEALLAEQELIVVVTPEPDGALARLAIASLEPPAVASSPLPSGPARLLALAGLAGARVLGEPVRAAVRAGR